MHVLFWILWITELILAGWWLWCEMKLTYLRTNPFVYLSLLYLLATLGVRYGLGWPNISLRMVTIPAVPLAGLAIIIIVATFSKGRWN